LGIIRLTKTAGAIMRLQTKDSYANITLRNAWDRFTNFEINEIYPEHSLLELDGMLFIKREYTKGEIDRAGRDMLALHKDNPARKNAIAIVDNWRSCHAYPLQIVRTTLFNRAKKIDANSNIPQRLKSKRSIRIKLRDNPDMKLSQMQDIAGCRAIMRSMKEVNQLKKIYLDSYAKKRKGRPEWDGSDKYDYITRPKNDGYRSLHFIFRYDSSSHAQQAYVGQRVEIQIRSTLQHSWATAVEVAQSFTGQALKQKIKHAQADWLRFFILSSGAFAFRESCPLVPSAPKNRNELIGELNEIEKRLNVINTLTYWSNFIEWSKKKSIPDAHSFLLILDVKKGNLNIVPFRKDESIKAEKIRDRVENAAEDDINKHVLLVSVEDINALPKAYPNYYANTFDFINAIKLEMAI